MQPEKAAKNPENTVKYWMELLIPSTAKTLAYYDHPHWGNYSAITYNQYGKGTAVYLGCYFDRDILKDVLRYLCNDADVKIPDAKYPVIIKRGVNDFGKEITYYFNYSDDVQTVTYHGADAVMLINESSDTVADDAIVSEENKIIITDGDTIKLTEWNFAVVESL